MHYVIQEDSKASEEPKKTVFKKNIVLTKT
jgi:hypothetical protein